MSNLKIVTGHYGSGKTEFCVNYAIQSVKINPTTLIDLDIVNPYFRSREQEALLSSKGVKVIGGSKGIEASDMPALPSSIYGQIDERFDTVIFDVGGDANGARALSRYSGLISKRDYDMYIVINANRPLTQTPEQAISYIDSIQAKSRLKINGLINSTHMLRETVAADIIKGYELCSRVQEATQIPIAFNVCPPFLNIGELEGIINKLFRIQLYMRPDWL
jgi:hypothetical protein